MVLSMSNRPWTREPAIELAGDVAFERADDLVPLSDPHHVLARVVTDNLYVRIVPGLGFLRQASSGAGCVDGDAALSRSFLE